MAICDTFLKKLRFLKDYGILHEDASQIIVFKEITLELNILHKGTFGDHERKEKKNYNIFFLISDGTNGEKTKLFSKHKLPIKIFSDKDQKISEERLKEELDLFVGQTFLSHQAKGVNPVIAGSSIIDPRLV